MFVHLLSKGIIILWAGLPIVPNGINLPLDAQGRASGEAYVQFTTPEAVDKALEKHKEKIGHRYIEIFRCSIDEMNSAIAPRLMGMRMGRGRPTPYDRIGGGMGMRSGGFSSGYSDFDDVGYGGFGGSAPSNYGGFGAPFSSYGGFGSPLGPPGRMGPVGGGSFRIQMRGLPYKASEADIAAFFRPLRPVYINISYNDQGKPSGEAYVEFATYDEAIRAMDLDKANMQNRYIELFMEGPGSAGAGGGRFRSEKKFGGMGRR
ncbi:hypothetical protein QYM36_011239 [Artemia franciscana]|uniref:RRM domain-containing protein n=1 Tax=Artemia franciscana TaxID=6661 RepID=A0AA88HS04_ARTSF|nr:hypothetical protein QYM36_011239 [Artemia franciscana]